MGLEFEGVWVVVSGGFGFMFVFEEQKCGKGGQSEQGVVVVVREKAAMEKLEIAVCLQFGG